MMTFFTILLILIGANAVVMVLSLNGLSTEERKGNGNPVEQKSSNIYPLQDSSSKFKKAG
ncbi:hypothetical protein [Pseudozobellia thermophila]|uniref:Uncharacterized protein n=1 Tax=Pseudozobellia thermophila TaxID=192903 RepID=A0A1M6HQS9_9FLAO|nr:hypothetical protein [Pseudozobellia thermophila]SHJ24572.1 hypothetical protein SAMN04488513_103142 [Pseudozobellia thermophila]